MLNPCSVGALPDYCDRIAQHGWDQDKKRGEDTFIFLARRFLSMPTNQ